MPAEGHRCEVAPHLCSPGARDERTGEVVCAVCGAELDAVYSPGPPRADTARMLDELRATKTSFTATLQFRTDSAGSDERVLVDVGREMRRIRRREEASAPVRTAEDATGR